MELESEQEPELELELHCTFRDPYCAAFKNAEVHWVNKAMPAMGQYTNRRSEQYTNTRRCQIRWSRRELQKHLERK